MDPDAALILRMFGRSPWELAVESAVNMRIAADDADDEDAPAATAAEIETLKSGLTVVSSGVTVVSYRAGTVAPINVEERDQLVVVSMRRRRRDVAALAVRPVRTQPAAREFRGPVRRSRPRNRATRRGPPRRRRPDDPDPNDVGGGRAVS
jgi:hypothetical protein